MITTTYVTIYQHEQPEPAWTGLDELLAEAAPGLPADTTLDFRREVSLSSEDEADALAARLRNHGLVVHVVSDTVLEDSDYDLADYVGIDAADPLDGLVLNADTALAPAGPCPGCGGQDTFDVTVVEAFEIDPSALDRSVDVVQLPGGGLAVSGELAGRLGGLSGVIGSELAQGLVQLTAERRVLVPCRTHTLVLGERHCPDCGRAQGAVDGYYWVSEAQVAGADLVSRNRNGMSLLFASRRLLDALGSAPGLTTYDAMRVCRHD